MAKSRNLIVITAVVVVAILAGSWFLLISPKHAAAAALADKTTQEASAQRTLQQQIAMLKEDESQASVYQKRLDDVASHLPVDAALPSLMRELSKAAAKSNVRVDEITPTVPTAANAAFLPAPAVKPTPKVTAGDATPSAESPSAAPSAAAAAPAAPGMVLSQLPMTFVITGTYSGIASFLSEIQNFKRAFLVQTINLAIAPPPSKAKVGDYTGLLVAHIGASAFTSGTPAEAGLEASSLATPTAAPSAAVPPAPAASKGTVS